MLEKIGGPGRTRTCNQTVMSAPESTELGKKPGKQGALPALCSLSVHGFSRGSASITRPRGSVR